VGDINFERRVLHVQTLRAQGVRSAANDFLVELLRTRKKDNAECFEDSPWIFPL